jgi:hypothetical protein
MTRFKKIVLSLASGLMLFSAGMAGAQALEPVRLGGGAATTPAPNRGGTQQHILEN